MAKLTLTPQQTVVQPLGAYGLGLCTHVGRQQDPHHREKPDICVAPAADGYRGDHEHVRIPVEDMVEVVPFDGALSGQFGYLPVERIEVSGQKDRVVQGIGLQEFLLLEAL